MQNGSESSRLDRRKFLGVLAGGASLGLLAACTSATPSSPAAPAAGTPLPAAAGAAPASTSVSVSSQPQSSANQPKTGGTLRMAMVGDLTALEGQLIIPGALDTLWNVYDRLTQYDAKLQPQPMLAEKFEPSSDYKSIKLTLRPGVQFHTGRELTSQDIKANIERAKDPKVGVGQLSTMSSWWTDIQTPDAATLILISDQPRPAVFDYFEYLNIIDPVTAQGPDAATRAVGTGPFKFVEWANGDHLTFARNASYWQSGRPYVDQVVVSILRDQQAMVAQLEGGALDLIDSPPTTDATRLKSDPTYQFVSESNSGTYYLVAANAQLPPTDNKLVRQAINWTIDRQRFADTVLQGLNGAPKSLPWPGNSAANDPAKQSTYHQDLDRARSLVQQSGADGAQLDILLTAGNQEQAGLAQILQADLQKIGIAANIDSMDPAAWRAATASLKGWHINLASSDYSQLAPSSLATMSAWWSYSVSQTGFKADAYTQLVTQIGAEPDPAQRMLLYGQMNDYLLDQSFAMVTAPSAPRFIARANVSGARYNGHEALDLSGVWLA